MLYFKENIYLPTPDAFDPEDQEPIFDPYNFIIQTLVGDRDIFYGLQQAAPEDATERLKPLFPHACRFGGAEVLNSISKRLLEAIVQPDIWYEMNSYHLSYLYDSLGAVVEDYSYSDLDKRISMFPELMGADIDYNDFLDQYFFNTAFLIDPERFNNMDAKEKQQHGFTDPCLFGVINHLTPTKDEILLKQLEKDPFAKTE